MAALEGVNSDTALLWFATPAEEHLCIEIPPDRLVALSATMMALAEQVGELANETFKVEVATLPLPGHVQRIINGVNLDLDDVSPEEFLIFARIADRYEVTELYPQLNEWLVENASILCTYLAGKSRLDEVLEVPLLLDSSTCLHDGHHAFFNDLLHRALFSFTIESEETCPYAQFLTDHGGVIEIVDLTLNPVNITGQTLQKICDLCPNVRTVIVNHGGPRRFLEQLPELRHLIIHGQDFPTNGHWSRTVKLLHRLQSITLYCLSYSPNLIKELNEAGIRCTVRTLKSIAPCQYSAGPGEHRLEFRQSDETLTVAELLSHTTLPGAEFRLRELSITQYDLGGRLEAISQLASLEVLRLQFCRLIDEDVAELTPLRRLRHLGLAGNQLGNGALVAINTHRRLRELVLSKAGAEPLDLSLLGDLFRLRKITVSVDQVDPDSLFGLLRRIDTLRQVIWVTSGIPPKFPTRLGEAAARDPLCTLSNPMNGRLPIGRLQQHRLLALRGIGYSKSGS